MTTLIPNKPHERQHERHRMSFIKTMRFAFFGTPTLAVEILEALEEAGHTPLLIVTTPDRQKGRGMALAKTPVKAWSEAKGIDVCAPESLIDFEKEITKRDIEFAIVVAYGKIIPQKLLDAHPKGMFNIHYSLLPRWRGATPVESAILHGDEKTGVSIQKIVYELDAGPIVADETTPIEASETAPALRERLNAIAKKLLVQTMPAIADGTTEPREQTSDEVTTCGKIAKDDGLVSLSDTPIENYRKFRAYFGWPGVYTFFERNGKQIRTIITKARLENGKFVINSIKPEGKQEMPYTDFIRSGAKPIR